MSNNKISYEEAFETLQHIVRSLKAGNIGLEETIKLYKEGKKLEKYCWDKLKSAKLEIEELSGDSDIDFDQDI